MKIVVYTLPNCSGCRFLKEWLKRHNLPFEERNMEDTNVMAELIFCINYVSSAPVLEVDGKFYKEDEIKKWMDEHESLH